MLLLASGAATCSAEPILQLYIEGATYDTVDETWVLEWDPGAGPLRLWAIGNVAGPGGKGTIFDVKIAVAYASSLGLSNSNFSLTSSTTGGYGGFTDPSTPAGATFVQDGADGSVPKLSDGRDLPSHGVYGAGTEWTEYALGDLSLTDSPIGDFMTTVPVPSATKVAQINVYEFSVTGASAGDEFHFDLYDHIVSGTKSKAKFAPFSHDAGGSVVPEPTSMAGFGVLLAGFAVVAARRRRVANAA